MRRWQRSSAGHGRGPQSVEKSALNMLAEAARGRMFGARGDGAFPMLTKGTGVRSCARYLPNCEREG